MTQGIVSDCKGLRKSIALKYSVRPEILMSTCGLDQLELPSVKISKKK